jgi:hypothetical protein
MGDIALRGNKLTRTRVKKAAGNIVRSIGKVLKGPANKWRMDQAQRLKDYHRKTKIKKRKADRIEEGKSKSFHEKYIKSAPHETKVAISRSQHPKSWRRAGKAGGGLLKKIGQAIGKAVSKKKPVPKPSKPEPKIGSKEWFDKAGPFERNRVIARRESAKRGDVYNKAGTVVGTPNPHRSAEAIMKRHPGSYQLKKGKK